MFVVNINVVLLVAQRKNSFIASQQQNCFQLRSHNCSNDSLITAFKYNMKEMEVPKHANVY